MTTASLQAALLTETEALLSSTSEADTCLVAVNAIASLMDADQSVLWMRRFGGPKVVSIAGLATVERHTDFTHWFETLARQFLKPVGDAIVPVPDTFDDAYLQSERGLYLLEHSLHIRLSTAEGDLLGGLFVARDHACSAEELQALTRFSQSVVRMLSYWRARKRSRLSRWLPGPGLSAAVVLVIGLGVALMTPVRQSATASVEIIARDAMPITATQDGVIERVLVRPNQEVRSGTPLVRYDGAVVRSKLFVAQQNVRVAQAELERATGKAFGDDVARTELRSLGARVAEKSAETRYLHELARRLEIHATSEGLVIFSDAEEWAGRSVQSGERIMLLADPRRVWLALYVPVEEAIPLSDGPEVDFNLDIDPLRTLKARVVESAYEAVIMPDGRSAYLMHAVLDANEPPPRIGLKGAARVYGEPNMLGYLLIRKPLRALRRGLGW